MSRNQGRQRQAAYDKTRDARSSAGSRGAYVYGNTVRKLEPIRRQEQPPVRQPRPQVRKNRDRARYMSAGYVLFLAAALCAGAIILVNYIQLQARLTNTTKTVATKESQLNNMRIANDEAYNRVLNSIDLEEIKRVAIGELGMVYAEEGQIVSYTAESSDYMRQVTGSGH